MKCRFSTRISSLILGCAMVGLVTAEEIAVQPLPESSQLTAKQVIDDYVAATGGKDAYDKVKSLAMEMATEMKAQGIKAQIEVVTKDPDKLYIHQNVAGMAEVTFGYDGETGWSRDPILGLRKLEGQELANMKLGSRYDYFLDPESIFKSMEMVGTATLDGESVYVVLLTPQEGSPLTGYFSANSKLLLRTDMQQVSPMAKMTVSTSFEDYRKVGDILMAHKMVQATPMGEAVTTISAIKLNPTVDDSLFTMPQPTTQQAPAPEMQKAPAPGGKPAPAPQQEPAAPGK